jgi:hypothetical protein
MGLFKYALSMFIAVCCASLLIGREVRADETGEQQVPTNKEELDAVEVARTVLARALYVSPETLPVLSIEKQSWPNSGLGCASLDTATIRIPRRGYAVVLATPDGARHVHVAGRQSRICDLPPKEALDAANSPEALESPPPSYDLNAMVERSREDLARRLRAPVNSVRLVSFASANWPDNTMDCAVPYEQTRKKPIKGYRIQLRQGERVFVYHTDLVRSRPCPAIEEPPATAESNTPAPAPKKRKTSKPASAPAKSAPASPAPAPAATPAATTSTQTSTKAASPTAPSSKTTSATTAAPVATSTKASTTPVKAATSAAPTSTQASTTVASSATPSAQGTAASMATITKASSAVAPSAAATATSTQAASAAVPAPTSAQTSVAPAKPASTKKSVSGAAGSYYGVGPRHPSP